MAAAPTWTKISQNEFLPIAMNLLLLQKTFDDWQYGYLSVGDLHDKMGPTAEHPNRKRVLHIWAYGPTDDPIISVFFFLRRKHKKNDTQAPIAYCMTVGAKPLNNGGLSAVDLRREIGVACGLLRPIANNDGAAIEVMHAGNRPNFRHPNGNLATAYDNATGVNAATPKLVNKGSKIDVELVWADTLTSLTWLNATE